MALEDSIRMLPLDDFYLHQTACRLWRLEGGRMTIWAPSLLPYSIPSLPVWGYCIACSFSTITILWLDLPTIFAIAIISLIIFLCWLYRSIIFCFCFLVKYSLMFSQRVVIRGLKEKIQMDYPSIRCFQCFRYFQSWMRYRLSLLKDILL